MLHCVTIVTLCHHCHNNAPLSHHFHSITLCRHCLIMSPLSFCYLASPLRHNVTDVTGKKDSMEVNQSLDEITARWKKLTVEVTSVQTMLEEVVTYWRRYTACVDILTVWLADAEKMLDTPPQERGVSVLTILPHLVPCYLILFPFYPIHLVPPPRLIGLFTDLQKMCCFCVDLQNICLSYL